MQWRYQVVTLTDAQLENSETQLNTYGIAGWQVISVTRIAANKNVLIAKKQR